MVSLLVDLARVVIHLALTYLHPSYASTTCQIAT